MPLHLNRMSSRLSSILIYALILAHRTAAAVCTTAFNGTTTESGYVDYHLAISSLSNGSIITFSACSPTTDFDTVFSLHNADKSEKLDSCDDRCPSTSAACFQNGRLTTSSTIWDVPADQLAISQYILSVRGFSGATGSFSLSVTYDCADSIEILNPWEETIVTGTEYAESTVAADSDADSDDGSDLSVGALGYVWPLVIVGAGLCCCCCCIYAIGKCFADEKHLNNSHLSIVRVSVHHPTASHFLKVLFQVIVSACSIAGSLALSDSLGLSNEGNGFIAIMMGTFSIFFVCLRGIANYGHARGPRGVRRGVRDDNDAQTGYRAGHLVFLLGTSTVIATLADATFDMIQGVAALRGEEYSSSSAFILVFATFTGVAEEVVEGTFEILVIVFMDSLDNIGEKYRAAVFCIIILINACCVTELSLGIYLVSSFETDDSVFMWCGIVFQSLLLLVESFWVCYAPGIIQLCKLKLVEPCLKLFLKLTN